jgi:septation ring formation regulator EzrA
MGYIQDKKDGEVQLKATCINRGDNMEVHICQQEKVYDKATKEVVFADNRHRGGQTIEQIKATIAGLKSDLADVEALLKDATPLAGAEIIAEKERKAAELQAQSDALEAEATALKTPA